MIKLRDILNEIVNLSLSPFEFDQDGNEARIKRDINNNQGWRRESSDSASNKAIKDYLDKYTSNFKWNSNAPKSEKPLYKPQVSGEEDSESIEDNETN